MPPLRVTQGTYVLLLEMASARRLSIGRLGVFDFPAGWYTYAGSARGAGGLTARLRHHLAIAAHPHWHMDYLRAHGRIPEIWYGGTGGHDEHRWADGLRAMAKTAPVAEGFGSSDCRCRTHLIRFAKRPDIRGFRRRLRSGLGASYSPVYRHRVGAAAEG